MNIDVNDIIIDDTIRIPLKEIESNYKIVKKNSKICPYNSCVIVKIPDDWYSRPCNLCIWYNPDADRFCQFPLKTLALPRKYEVDTTPCRFHLTEEELDKIMMPYWS